MTTTEDKVFVRITNKDIYQKLLDLEKTSSEVLEQQRITNGRVSTLEKKSIGMWMSRNPLKTTGTIILIISTLGLSITDAVAIVLRAGLI